MTLAERIKACRAAAGLSQEKVAEAVGVSRQAVAKWESGQSAPGMENLFKLAELFGTTADLLLCPEKPSAREGEEQLNEAGVAARLFALQKEEEARVRAQRRARRKQNLLLAAAALAVYALFYVVLRLSFDSPQGRPLLGWLFAAGDSQSYLLGWLCRTGLWWACAALGILLALFGKRRCAAVTAAGFAAGFLLGELFGPNPQGAFTGSTHYGWAIWGGVFLLSLAMGCALEVMANRGCPLRSRAGAVWAGVFLLGAAGVVILVCLGKSQV